MQVVFVVPGGSNSGRGAGAYAAAMADGLRAMGHAAEVAEGAPARLPPGAVPVIDGMLLPALLPRLDELVARDAVALVHHVSAAAGRDEAGREATRAAECAMLPVLRRVVATSGAVAAQLRDGFGVAEPHVVVPGLGNPPRTMPDQAGGCRMLALGVLTPRKGHDRLLRAVAPLQDLDWTLTIAGDAGRDPVHAAGLSALIEDFGLSGRVTLLPDPDDAALEGLWQAASLFALGTHWEGYPAAIAEALRRGIPPVVTEWGGAAEMIPQRAGVVCPEDDPATFSKSLRRAVFDRALRTEMADAAWRAGQALPGWPEQVRALHAVLAG